MRERLRKEAATVHKEMDEKGETEGLQRKAARLARALDSIDQGLERPYLAIAGFTAPRVFDTLMTEEMATAGFLGRALIFREHEDNPKRKRASQDKRVPNGIASRLQFLYAPGLSEVPERVEAVGAVKDVPTNEDASALLDAAEAAFWEMAESAKEKGLAPIPNRGWELTSKVSMLLAIPGGVRTAEHVRWAYALVRQDIEGKMLLTLSNSGVDAQDKLSARILSVVTDEGVTLGVLRNRCRQYKAEDVDRCCDILAAQGQIISEVTEWRGRATRKLYRSSAKPDNVL